MVKITWRAVVKTALQQTMLTVNHLYSWGLGLSAIIAMVVTTLRWLEIPFLMPYLNK